MNAMTERLVQIVLLVVIVGGWQAGVTTGFIDPFFFPAPLDIFNQVVSWVMDSSFYNHVVITLTETVLGYLVGTALGVAAGVWLGLSRSA
ncbi:MAG: ABC transporter permease, partial [Rhizobiaceae bacterium]|nr:ABC transporter permease [Rhizobiaceae bacterium]